MPLNYNYVNENRLSLKENDQMSLDKNQIKLENKKIKRII